MIKLRQDVSPKDCWNVEALYPSLAEWQKAYDKVARDDKHHHPRWPEIGAFRGRLHENAETLKGAIELILGLDRVLYKLFTYAHLRHDEDITDDQHKVAYSRIMSVMHEFGQEVSWFDPELLALPETTIREYLASPVLKDYRYYLEKIFRMKPHTLSAESEEVMALAGKALQTPQKAFSAISDADFKFGKVKDSQGKEHEITHGQYGMYIRDQDRTLRQNAFKQYHDKYFAYENTLCELLSGQVNKNIFNAQVRHYKSSLDAALFPHNIETSVYHSLVDAVNDKIDSIHQYMDLRKDILKLDELHLYDLYVPLTPHVDIKMSYEEAEELIVESVAPLGDDYQRTLRKGLLEQRWVDRYENKNKRSGAYSSGCYDSMPYILMNYKGILRDVFTLAHEAGHSMHSLLSRKTQPYQYADYPIFVAEVASTFNEELLMRQLLKKYTGKAEQIFLINQRIDDIRATLFRQTMFAEFELAIHEMVERGNPLTPQTLKEQFRALNEKYYGDRVVVDSEIDIEWARIPHFYYNFYVYQYATGISAALALVNGVLNGGQKERDAYLTFLSSGGNRYPIDLLRSAGVDMRSSKPVHAAIDAFSARVNDLRQLQEESLSFKS